MSSLRFVSTPIVSWYELETGMEVLNLPERLVNYFEVTLYRANIAPFVHAYPCLCRKGRVVDAHCHWPVQRTSQAGLVMFFSNFSISWHIPLKFAGSLPRETAYKQAYCNNPFQQSQRQCAIMFELTTWICEVQILVCAKRKRVSSDIEDWTGSCFCRIKLFPIETLIIRHHEVWETDPTAAVGPAGICF